MTKRATAVRRVRRAAAGVAGVAPPLARLRAQRDGLAAALLAEQQQRMTLQAQLAGMDQVVAAETARPEDEYVRMAFPPGHFYSPIPDLREVTEREQQIFAVPETLPGIDLNVDGQLARLPEFGSLAADHPFSSGPTPGLRYQFANDFFGYGDGLVYYCMLRSVRPRRIVEVGSGWSSALALDVDDNFLGAATEMTFIEPYPERLAQLIHPADRDRARVLEQPLYEVDRQVFADLQPDDVLFIDSTHVCKIGSDVNQLVFEVLPTLPPGVHIHVHDIFYPFEYPRSWVFDGRAWSEAYLLRAFLTANARVKITWFNSYLHHFHRDEVSRAMPPWGRNTGGSLWLQTL